MKLSNPFFISSNLCPAFRLKTAVVSLQRLPKRDEENRDVFQWEFSFNDGDKISNCDLRSGCGGCSMQEAFRALLSFMGSPDDCFPEKVADFCREHSYEIEALSLDLEGLTLITE